MPRPRTAALLLFVLVLVGVGTFAVARVRTAELRTLPYEGVLKRDGVGITGPVTARFGLFGSADADTRCVVTNDCPLWSEEQVVDVVDGTFSVLLGEGGGRALTSTVLASPELFVAVAVKEADDVAFTALSGVDEIVAAPLLQPGAATAVSFATNTFFSAKLVPNGSVYAVQDATPAGWIPTPPTGAVRGGVAQILPNQALGVSRLVCVATTNEQTRRMVIPVARPDLIQVQTIAGDSVLLPAPFTLMCHGF